MYSVNVSAAGDYVLHDQSAAANPLGIGLDRQAYLAVGLRGTQGTAVVAIQYSPDGGATWANMESLNALVVGNTRTAPWPASQFRAHVTGTGTLLFLDYAIGS